MKHSHKKETRKKVDFLLYQYEQYNKAHSETEKDKIGDEMTYTDPIVWMMYKREAYARSDHEITTLGDLKGHSIDHGGICAKRMKFLALFIKENYRKDILDSNEFSDDMELTDFYDSNLINEVVLDNDFIQKWKTYEFFKKDGKVSKWENYLA